MADICSARTLTDTLMTYQTAIEQFGSDFGLDYTDVTVCTNHMKACLFPSLTAYEEEGRNDITKKIESGWDIKEIDENNYFLLYTDNNKKRIMEYFRNTFPTSSCTQCASTKNLDGSFIMTMTVKIPFSDIERFLNV